MRGQWVDRSLVQVLILKRGEIAIGETEAATAYNAARVCRGRLVERL